ncbi:MAG TPA: hypothetical protein VF065_12540 [Ilumatobacter sp.]
MDWLTPTRRAVRWLPMITASTLAAATIGFVRLIDRPLRSDALIVSLVMVVIGTLCGLHDPGRDFVHAMPVSSARRLSHRLSMLVPALLAVLVLLRALTATLFSAVPPAPGWAELLALGAVGVAACAVVTRRLGTRAVDAVVSGMLAWLVAAMSADHVDVPLGVAMPWWRWPVAVAASAVVVTVVATTRGVEA